MRGSGVTGELGRVPRWVVPWRYPSTWSWRGSSYGIMWDVPPTLGHSFPAPARSPLPHPLPRPLPLPPPAALLWALLPSFRLASSRSVSCCRAPWPASRCSCSPRVLFPFRFVSPRWPSFLYWLLPGATSISPMPFPVWHCVGHPEAMRCKGNKSTYLDKPCKGGDIECVQKLQDIEKQ